MCFNGNVFVPDDSLSVFPVRSATIDVDGLKLNIGIAHGLHNVRKLLEDIEAGKCQFHAIEIVACYVRGSGGIVDEYRNME